MRYIKGNCQLENCTLQTSVRLVLVNPTQTIWTCRKHLKEIKKLNGEIK